MLEIGNYYLLRDGKILRVDYDDDNTPPILGYGELGGEFTHLNSTALSFEEAKTLYGDRVVGVAYEKHSSYHFWRDDDNPSLFFIFIDTCFKVDSAINEFESWFNGEVYDVKFYEFGECDLELVDSFVEYDSLKYESDILKDVDSDITFLLNYPRDMQVYNFVKNRIEESLND